MVSEVTGLQYDMTRQHQTNPSMETQDRVDQFAGLDKSRIHLSQTDLHNYHRLSQIFLERSGGPMYNQSQPHPPTTSNYHPIAHLVRNQQLPTNSNFHQPPVPAPDNRHYLSQQWPAMNVIPSESNQRYSQKDLDSGFDSLENSGPRSLNVVPTNLDNVILSPSKSTEHMIISSPHRPVSSEFNSNYQTNEQRNTFPREGHCSSPTSASQILPSDGMYPPNSVQNPNRNEYFQNNVNGGSSPVKKLDYSDIRNVQGQENPINNRIPSNQNLYLNQNQSKMINGNLQSMINPNNAPLTIDNIQRMNYDNRNQLLQPNFNNPLRNTNQTNGNPTVTNPPLYIGETNEKSAQSAFSSKLEMEHLKQLQNSLQQLLMHQRGEINKVSNLPASSPSEAESKHRAYLVQCGYDDNTSKQINLRNQSEQMLRNQTNNSKHIPSANGLNVNGSLQRNFNSESNANERPSRISRYEESRTTADIGFERDQRVNGDRSGEAFSEMPRRMPGNGANREDNLTVRDHPSSVGNVTSAKNYVDLNQRSSLRSSGRSTSSNVDASEDSFDKTKEENGPKGSSSVSWMEWTQQLQVS